MRKVIIEAIIEALETVVAVTIISVLAWSFITAAAEAEVTPEYIEITEGPESAVEAAPELEELGSFLLTYYCPGRCCNGKNPGIDCFGNPLKWGTVAVDPEVIPLHTKLVIDGFDAEFEALDTGEKWVKGKHIDIFVPVSHQEAEKMNDAKPRATVWRIKEK